MNPPAGPGGSEPARDNLVGAVLIVIAVVIGVVLLVKGYDEEGTLVSTGDDTEQATTTTSVDPDATTTTVPPAVRPPAEVPVMVANGAGVSGAAGTLQAQLQGDGYTQVETTNASPVTTTLVYFVEGSQAEAEALATTLGTDPAAVRVMPAEPPADPAGASLLVVLGPDLAA
ncbi:LytR C-terminal domain-containing protein [Rhabdothermincola salaria]|uniref:LytR C-terminal domain-containing protein n=1 Tax=Rhabdothermincola salaria TaxID=2903142 RepID=UPI001E29485E|nr:LytR C-terminal domain-containing protein [Rhabdothermincola salaria]